MAENDKANILIVDDSPGKLLAMSAALAELHGNVVTANSGREALRRLLQQEFAVILLDVHMPEMDGFETAALIRERSSSAHVPIIFITAYGDDARASQGYSLGAVDYLMTPVVPEILRAKVSVFVELYRKNMQIQAQAEERVVLAHEQAARRTAEAANRMKDEFLATLSHELRSPLHAILGWVQLLRVGRVSAEELANGLEVIERNARLQATIIEDLLDVSRIISGKLQLETRPASAAEVVDAAIESVQVNADARRIRIERDWQPDLPPVVVDPMRLQQVVSNLLSNALKFTPIDGRVVASVKVCGAELEIAVADSGEGIEPEFLPYVFERFRQADASTSRQHGGLGIGLAIVRQLTEMHGGRVAVESAGAGRGAKFSVFLPIPAAPLPERPPILAPPEVVPEILAPPSLAGLRILVVDDQRDARFLLKQILQGQHAEVIDASSADEAQSLVDTFDPQVLVSDIGMPGRDGYDLIRSLRDKRGAAHLPAIALTAYARPEEQAKALEAGFQVHLAKPIDAHALLRAISRLSRQTAPNGKPQLEPLPTRE
jgi:signal transduction histidine kinase